MRDPQPHAEGDPEGVDRVAIQLFLQRGPNSCARATIRFGFLSLLGGAIVFALHGAAFHLTPWSQAIVNGIAQHWYPDIGQQDTTVVLFREENLERLHETYPISYQLHADVLDALGNHNPRAVFVDFVFLDQPKSGEEEKAKRVEDSRRLKGAICDLSQRGKRPVYLAVDPDGRTGITEELIDDERRPCVIKVTPEMKAAFGVSGILTYSNGVKTTSGFLPTPAFAMAIDNRKAIRGLCKDNQERADCARLLAEMEILWGNDVAELNTSWMPSCKPADWWPHLKDSIHHDPLYVKRDCPYSRTISVWDLIRSLRHEDPAVRRALEGKTVLYGAGFQMAGDIVTTPVYSDLPAVYLHAMAYDNLRTFGANYKRADREISFPAVLVDAGLVLLIASVSLFIDRLVAQFAGAAPRSKWLALGAGLLLTSAAFVPTRGFPTWVPVAVLWWGAWGAFLFGPILVGIFGILFLAARRQDAGTDREFAFRLLLAVLIVGLGVLLFLEIARAQGLDSALLVVLPVYFLYKLFVVRKAGAVATTVLLVLASVVSFWPANLGPRNIVAYLFFFEVAERLIERADDVGREYARLRMRNPGAEKVPWAWRISDWLFTLWLRDAHPHDLRRPQ